MLALISLFLANNKYISKRNAQIIQKINSFFTFSQYNNYIIYICYSSKYYKISGLYMYYVILKKTQAFILMNLKVFKMMT